MTDIGKLKTLVELVKQSEYYIPRTYQTLGGMWTTDTYERDGVKVQIMDEGYSTCIISENLNVWILYDAKVNDDYLHYKNGSIDIIEELLLKLSHGKM